MEYITLSSIWLGLLGGSLFMIVGWPLVKVVECLRIVLGPFGERIVVAAFLGVLAAPLAAQHAPGMTNNLVETVQDVETVRTTFDRIAKTMN